MGLQSRTVNVNVNTPAPTRIGRIHAVRIRVYSPVSVTNSDRARACARSSRLHVLAARQGRGGRCGLSISACPRPVADRPRDEGGAPYPGSAPHASPWIAMLDRILSFDLEPARWDGRTDGPLDQPISISTDHRAGQGRPAAAGGSGSGRDAARQTEGAYRSGWPPPGSPEPPLPQYSTTPKSSVASEASNNRRPKAHLIIRGLRITRELLSWIEKPCIEGANIHDPKIAFTGPPRNSL
jgi:hypothetical protein